MLCRTETLQRRVPCRVALEVHPSVYSRKYRDFVFNNAAPEMTSNGFFFVFFFFLTGRLCVLFLTI